MYIGKKVDHFEYKKSVSVRAFFLLKQLESVSKNCFHINLNNESTSSTTSSKMILYTKLETVLKTITVLKIVKRDAFKKLAKKVYIKRRVGYSKKNAMVENLACECIQQVYVNTKRCIFVNKRKVEKTTIAVLYEKDHPSIFMLLINCDDDTLG